MKLRTCAVVTGVLTLAVSASAGDGPGPGETITLSMKGATKADGGSTDSSISHTGRWVAFASSATNLSVPAGNGISQVLLRDRKKGTTRLLSIADGELANGPCDSPALSANGRYVAFRTAAPNFPDSNSKVQVYRHDRVTGATVLVSVDVNGAPSGDDCRDKSIDISKNGRFVVFSTPANLIGGLGNFLAQAYRRDVKKGITTLVSVSTTKGLAAEEVKASRISDNGRWVAFASEADNLTVDANPLMDVFLRDMKNGVTTLVSITPGGGVANGTSSHASISGNGRYLAFASKATNLVTGDTGNDWHLVVFNKMTGERKHFHSPLSGQDGLCRLTSLSRNGKAIAFSVNQQNSAITSDDDEFHAYFASWKTGAIAPVNVDSGESMSTSEVVSDPVISGNGKFIVFQSDSESLGADHDSQVDVFLRRVK